MEVDEPTHDPGENQAFEEAARELKELQLVTRWEEEIKEDKPMSLVATKTDVAQIAFSGIPQPMSFSQATTLTGGQSGSTAARPSHSQVSTSGTTGRMSGPVQTASSMAGGRSQGTGTVGQPSGLGGGQQGTSGTSGGGMGLPQGGQLLAGVPAGSGGGGGSSGRGGGGPPGVQLAQAPQAPVQGPVPPANGVLRGHPPQIFDGHWKNT